MSVNFMDILNKIRDEESKKAAPAVPDKVRDAFQEQLDAQSLQIAAINDGMTKIANLLYQRVHANQEVQFVSTMQSSAAKTVIPTIKDEVPVATLPVVSGEKVAPATFYRLAIEQLRGKNKPYGKDGKISKGVHAVYGGLNVEVKKYFGPKTDVVALTNMLESQGVIVTRMVKGGPMVYLPEDFKTEGQVGSSIVIH